MLFGKNTKGRSEAALYLPHDMRLLNWPHDMRPDDLAANPAANQITI